MDKGLISFSLYGYDRSYYESALRLVENAREIYPGYICRFYVSQEVGTDTQSRLRDAGCELVHKERIHEMDGMYWRFLAASDASYDRVLIRDLDTGFGPRDQLVHEEWIASGKDFHLTRDAPSHCYEILGGSWSCRGGVVPDMEELIEAWGRSYMDAFRSYGMDQLFLARVIYPRMRASLCVHTTYIRFVGERVWPSPPHNPTDAPVVIGGYLDNRVTTFKDVYRHRHRRYKWRIPLYLDKKRPLKFIDAIERRVVKKLFFFLRLFVAFMLFFFERVCSKKKT